MLRIRDAVPDDAPRIAAFVRALNTHEREPVEPFDENAARRDGLRGRTSHGFYRALGATEEPVIAHAVVFDKFERLAAEATRG